MGNHLPYCRGLEQEQKQRGHQRKKATTGISILGEAPVEKSQRQSESPQNSCDKGGHRSLALFRDDEVAFSAEGGWPGANGVVETQKSG